jgi:hypothetical protein
MARSRSAFGLVAAAAAGVALLVTALVPGPWPNPLPQGPLAAGASLQRVRAAAAAVDAACERGDLDAFAGAVTAAHRQRLAGRLQSIDLAFDAAALRGLASGPGCAELQDRDPWAAAVRGDRAVLVVPRRRGDGAQVLTFRWDGHRLRLDGSLHAVAVADADAAAAALEQAFAAR